MYGWLFLLSLRECFLPSNDQVKDNPDTYMAVEWHLGSYAEDGVLVVMDVGRFDETKQPSVKNAEGIEPSKEIDPIRETKVGDDGM